MKRTLQNFIKKDIPDKIILLSGPRQVGKTFLSEMISDNYQYYNYDLAEDRLSLKEKSWLKDRELIIFDELHKMPQWKSWLKGIYDTKNYPAGLLVTGSAKLNIYRKMGDSLAGRFFQYRLHPFDLKELKGKFDPEDTFNRLITLSGFPEPFLKNDNTFYHRWKKSHLDIILRQDLLDLENVHQIQSIETLIELLKHRVGSPISYLSLAEDLQKDAKTIKRWLTLLENMYLIFSITPYHKNIARSLLKSPKYYFYDNARVVGDNGVKLENLAACALKKELHFLEDTLGFDTSLHYLRNKDGKEIDFLVVINNQPVLMLEIKWANNKVSKNFHAFIRYLPDIAKIQLVKDIHKEKEFASGIKLLNAVHWFENIDLARFG